MNLIFFTYYLEAVSQNKTSECVPKQAPLVGSLSPGDGVALTASHCPALDYIGCVQLATYWRGLIAYIRSSATFVTCSFMLQKKEPFCLSYLLTKLLQDPYFGRAKQGILLSSVSGYRVISGVTGTAWITSLQTWETTNPCQKQWARQRKRDESRV